MKKIFAFTCSFVILWLYLALPVFAETYYCVPNDNGKYICEPAGEIREYPNGKTSSPKINGFVDKFRCYKENGKWICVPFDEGAIIMEPEHKCSERTYRWYNNL